MKSRTTDGADIRRQAPGERGLPLALLAALVVAGALAALWRASGGGGSSDRDGGVAGGAWRPAPAAGSPTVALTIDFGNGVRREFAALPWSQGMTVGGLLRAAQNFPPGIAVAARGEGAMTLLTAIDGVANQAGGGRCWLYEVNGRPGEASYEVHPLVAGDRVLWVFSQGG